MREELSALHVALSSSELRNQRAEEEAIAQAGFLLLEAAKRARFELQLADSISESRGLVETHKNELQVAKMSSDAVKEDARRMQESREEVLRELADISSANASKASLRTSNE